MYSEIAKLVVWRDFDKDDILMPIAGIIEDYKQYKAAKDNGEAPQRSREELVSRIYAEIHKLLDIATRYGFDNNLWHNYLTYLLVTNENPFAITCEKVGAREGSVTAFAKSDLKVMKYLFDYDFTDIEKELDINCFSVISDYHSIQKDRKSYNYNVSEKVRKLSLDLEEAADEEDMFKLLTAFYRDFGVGKFGLNKAFRLARDEKGL